MQGGRGEVVIIYREPFPTQQMGYHRLSQQINKIENKDSIIFFLRPVYKSNHTFEIKVDS
jgi:hypothetical protein